MAKRAREFQSVSFEQQLKAFKPLRVNPFSMMVEAARTAAHQDTANQQAATTHAEQRWLQHSPSSTGQQQGNQPNHGSYVPCTHCGCGLPELAVQQCHRCKNVYCSSCSVANYDAREDRVFCLDCLPGAAVTCCGREDDDLEMRYQCDQSTYDHFDRPAFDLHSSTPPTRDITGCGQPSRNGSSSSRSSSSSLMRACNQAAAAAAASAAANGSTPFNSLTGSFPDQCRGSLFGASHVGSRAAAAAGAWDISGHGSPGMLAGPGRAGGQLLATSPVIPFVGMGCEQGYLGLATRVCGAGV